MSYFDQSRQNVRFEWGCHALEHVARSEVVIIVDVLSFTTCVDIAVSRGARIYPYPWKGDAAADFAAKVGATLATRRDDVAPGTGYTLSPSSLINIPRNFSLVLPSPNGSSLAFEARDMGSIVVAGCLRNARAVGQWAKREGKTVTVVAAGERWPDGSIRFATEDLMGAGAILQCIDNGTATSLSVEAMLAIASYKAAKERLLPCLMQMSSGRELQERGYVGDIELAAELDVSETIPVLRGEFFTT